MLVHRRRRLAFFSSHLAWFTWYAVLSRQLTITSAADDDDDVDDDDGDDGSDDDDDNDEDDGNDDDQGDDGGYDDDAWSEYPYCKGDVDFIEDGICDSLNNIAACGYDGGDCCECTCRENLENECGHHGIGYFCLDPDAGCPTATPAPVTPATLAPAPITPTNIPTPSPTEAVEAPSSASSGDPTATPTGFLYPDCPEIGIVEFIGDGRCDDHNNHAECGYDGGDCCPCTCGDYFGCGVNGFDCIDPDTPPDCHETDSPTPAPSIPVDSGTSSSSSRGAPSSGRTSGGPVDLSDCTGFAEYVGDGDCDDYNNNEACNYDGGDCCECSCINGPIYDCGVEPYDCADPEYIAECPTRPTPSPTVVAAVVDELQSTGPKSRDDKLKDVNDIGTVLISFLIVCVVVGSLGFMGAHVVRYRRAKRAAGIAASKQHKVAPGAEDDFDDMVEDADNERGSNGGGETRSESKVEPSKSLVQ